MWGTTEGYMSFTNNFVKNTGAATDNYTGYQDDPRGSPNVAQAVYVRGPAIRITDNVGINILGESNVEDVVNLFQSFGTASDPILIARNKFNGGKAPTGFGILLGDGPEGYHGSYAVAEDNILVNTGAGGLNIAGGHDNIARNNKIYGDVKDASYPTVGLAAGGDCSTHVIEYNEVTFYKGATQKWNLGGVAYLYPYSGCAGVAGWSTNKFDTPDSQPASLDASIWNPAWNSPSFLISPDNPYFYSSGAQ